ncbi:hypothetical protein KEM48_009482 [Puccinia striiformis f. sp. tritici PST-130]|nr:hypothetical protein KEM48_009482 [Puccinia striiformis f. sp. tritici PST-130]
MSPDRQQSSHVHPELTGNDKRVPGTKSNKKMKSSQISKQVGRKPLQNSWTSPGPSAHCLSVMSRLEMLLRDVSLEIFIGLQAATARQIKTNSMSSLGHPSRYESEWVGEFGGPIQEDLRGLQRSIRSSTTQAV